MKPNTCATCRHWVRSHLEHHQGEGICSDTGVSTKSGKRYFKRPIYVRADDGCERHEELSARWIHSKTEKLT